ncbi:hypothetical protein TAMA11512_09390 [Selenomonas sp. TAMA-11512]|uniref:hypothetical protein n=1 Tax=Selenomonas sp. TAMA-11512 TaxID=3095337 RepID=UPI003093DD2D|nr:hypothetical protein TAMA11512_09390 [Selenomonas sp. TAMA-11512]
MTEQEAIEAIRSQRPFKLRTMTEVMAQYEKKILKYQELMKSSDNNRQQRMEVYAEIRILGWVLYKTERQVQKDLQVSHVNQ